MSRPRKTATSRGVRHTSIGQPLGRASLHSSQNSSSLFSQRVTKTYSQAQVNEQIRSDAQIKDQLLAGLTPAQREQYKSLGAHDWSPVPDTGNEDTNDWFDCKDDVDSEVHDLRSIRSTDHITGLRQKPKRDWADRTKGETSNWGLQMPRLVTAFLKWKHAHHVESPITNQQEQATNSGTQFSVDVINIFDLHEQSFELSGDEIYHNESLIRAGYLSSSPVHPHTAISLDCLRFYYTLRGRCGNLSVESFVCVLCDLNNMHFHEYYSTQFSQAFATYVAILQEVSKRLDKVLGRDTPDWRRKNQCPPCSYVLESEGPLTPTRMFSMDGNNSLKRLAHRGQAKQEQFATDYVLLQESVDALQDEVQRKHKQTPPPEMNASDEEISAEFLKYPSPDAPGPTDSDKLATTCARNWRAAQAQDGKKVSQVFDETGIFLACCRHGLVDIMVDMIQSGELAKYPLAVFEELVRVHGPNLVIGYDIACSFDNTLRSSPKLASVYKESGVRLIVPAFHAYAHNRLCQLSWHPLWQEGLGLEDFEGCERVFSSSNAVARCTRHASPFTRHMYMDLHFQRWNADRYASLGRFLFNNFHQALVICQEYGAILDHLPPDQRITDQEVEKLVAEEASFLQSLKSEPPEDALRVEYVQQLEKLFTSQQQYDKAWAGSETISPPSRSGTPIQSVSQVPPSVLQKRQASEQRLLLALTAVQQLEEELGIVRRWDPSMPEYTSTLQYVADRKYYAAVDRLEFLLTQRLGEIAKLNVGGLGYKLRQHIFKALKSRSQAIRTAIKRYNTLACQMTPPRPALTYDQVVKHAFLSEFDFLRLSREQSRTGKWAQPVVRQALEACLRVRRAKEETFRIQIEARRLLTYMEDEESQLSALANSFQIEDPGLAAEVLSLLQHQKAANVLNRTWLNKLLTHVDFDGSPNVGKSLHGYPVPSATPPVYTARPENILLQKSRSGVELSLDEANEEDFEEMYMAIEDFACNQ